MTTASIMFKPSANDPLVLEHGQSPFGVILPMKDITFTSIVSDFAKLVESSPKLYVVYVHRMSVYGAYYRQRSKISQENELTDTTDTLTPPEQTKQVPPSDDVDSGCGEETTPGKSIDSSTEPSEEITSKEKPPVLRIFAPSTEDSDLSPLPPTPGRVVRVFTDPQPKQPPHHDDSTDEMLAIMGAVDGQDQEGVEVNPSIHRLMMNPEVMNFKPYQHCNTDDSAVIHKDIDTPQFLKIQVASHAYHTFVPTVGMGSNISKGKNDAKVLVHTKTEFWFAFPSERQVTNIMWTLQPLAFLCVTYHLV